MGTVWRAPATGHARGCNLRGRIRLYALSVDRSRIARTEHPWSRGFPGGSGWGGAPKAVPSHLPGHRAR
eukprot:7387144-Prymnesium_polylepis.2